MSQTYMFLSGLQSGEAGAHEPADLSYRPHKSRGRTAAPPGVLLGDPGRWMPPDIRDKQGCWGMVAPVAAQVEVGMKAQAVEARVAAQMEVGVKAQAVEARADWS